MIIEQDHAQQLDRALTLSLSKSIDILEMSVKPEDANFARLISAQVATARTVIQASIRVDEHRLKRRTQDGLAELLKKLRGETAPLIDQ